MITTIYSLTINDKPVTVTISHVDNIAMKTTISDLELDDMVPEMLFYHLYEGHAKPGDVVEWCLTHDGQDVVLEWLEDAKKEDIYKTITVKVTDVIDTY